MTLELKKPCVLLTSNQYKPNIGGIENSLYHLAQEYKAIGCEVIIAASDLNPSNQPLPDHEIEDDVIVYRYKAEKDSGFGRGIKHILNAIKVYKKIFMLHKPDFTVCRFHFNVVILKALGYKNIIYLVPGVVENETRASLREQSSFLTKFTSKLSFEIHKKMQYLAFKHSDKLFVFSENMLKQVRDINKTKPIGICKPGVSLTRFTSANIEQKIELRQQLNLSPQNRVFLCIGRFVKAKGFDIAIKALKELDDKNTHLWLLGEGAEECELRQLCSRLGLEERVKFLGRQATPEKYYRAADFFIMSSNYEPLGQTILEALCCGLPIVGAKSSETVVTATSEILSVTDNILLDEYSASSFSQGMNECINLSENDYLKLQVENRKLAEVKFSWQKLAEDLFVYD